MTILSLLFSFFTFYLAFCHKEEVQRLTHADHTYYKSSGQHKSNLVPPEPRPLKAKGQRLIEKLRRRLTTMPLDAKRAMLDIHNEYRSQVALGDVGDEPRAKNMNFLRWDEGLEIVATNYATECIWAHNGEREQDYIDAVTNNGNNIFSFTVPSSNFAVGENLYITSENSLGTGDDLIDELEYGIYLWFEEHEIWDFDTQTCTPTPSITACGHYEQMMWAKTRYVGCGYHECPGPISGLSGSWYDDGASIVVCNYYFAGNYIGQDGYEKATNHAQVGSNCEADTGIGSFHWGGLCSGCPNPDYPDTTSSPGSCDDGLGRTTFAPTYSRAPTPVTPSPTVRPTPEPTTPTQEPTDRPTYAGGYLGSEGFNAYSNIDVTGTWSLLSVDNGINTYTTYDASGCACDLYLRFRVSTNPAQQGWYIATSLTTWSYWTYWLTSETDITKNQPGDWGLPWWPGIFISIQGPTTPGTPSPVPAPTSPLPTTPQPTTPQPTTPQPTTPQPTTPQPTTPQPTSTGGTRTCSYVSGIRYNGVQLGGRINGVASREDCCAFCIADTACVAMKYNTNNDRCWLLSQKDSQTNRAQFESADIVVS